MADLYDMYECLDVFWIMEFIIIVPLQEDDGYALFYRRNGFYKLSQKNNDFSYLINIMIE